MQDIDILKLRFQNIFHEKTQGEIIRSRTKYYKEGEKNSRVFLNLKKSQSSNDTIHKLQLSDNKITQDPHKILLQQRLFYKGIHTKTQHWHRSMNLTESEDIPALLITTDFEKVFDCFKLVFLTYGMMEFKFPDYILRWVEILYTDIDSCVTNNGHVTEYFKLERAVC